MCPKYTSWLKVYGNLTIGSICGSFPNCCHEFGSAQLYRIFFACCNITISLYWNKEGQTLFRHDNAKVAQKLVTCTKPWPQHLWGVELKRWRHSRPFHTKLVSNLTHTLVAEWALIHMAMLKTVVPKLGGARKYMAWGAAPPSSVQRTGFAHRCDALLNRSALCLPSSCLRPIRTSLERRRKRQALGAVLISSGPPSF